MSSSPEPEKRKRCEPGCECGRHRRRAVGGVVPAGTFTAEREAPEVFIPAPVGIPVTPVPAAEVSVLVPTRLDRERRDLWDFCRMHWEKAGYEIVEGRHDRGPWCKAAAVADAFSRASGQILVVADADVWCDGIPQAVAAVKAGAGWAIPHYQVLRLTRPATAYVLSGGKWPNRGTTINAPSGPIPAYAQRPYPGRPGGGVVVLSRATYEQVPLDPRFRGWGQEDESWALALGTLAGKSWRGTADLWHLWHEPAPRQSRTIGSQESMRLHRRYTLAARNKAKMAALVGEIKS